MNNVFNTTSKIEMSSPITYHGFHLQHEVHNNHLFIVIWAQPERMCSRNPSLNLFICHEFIQMGGLTTLQGSTQTYTNNLRDGKSTDSHSTKCWIYVMMHNFMRSPNNLSDGEKHRFSPFQQHNIKFCSSRSISTTAFMVSSKTHISRSGSYNIHSSFTVQYTDEVLQTFQITLHANN